MNIGKRIRKLRLEQGITQERLSEYLNISFQAISKWENETALPDIKLLRPISNFFGVTIDYLMDNEDVKEDVFVNDILEKYKVLKNKGRIPEVIDLMQAGLKEYPKNYTLMNKLAQALLTITKATHEEDMEKNALEAIKICGIIIDDSNDYGLIDDAIKTTFYANIDLKNYDEAKTIANKRSSMWDSKDILLKFTHSGKDANEYIQKLILDVMDMLSLEIFSLTYKRNGSDVYSVEDKIQITKLAINIIESILNDGNYLFYSVRLRRFYSFLGIYYAESNSENQMYESLDKAKELALYYDSLNLDANYTSIFANTQVFLSKETSINAEWTMFYLFKDRLKRKEFDPFRTEERFVGYFIENT